MTRDERGEREYLRGCFAARLDMYIGQLAKARAVEARGSRLRLDPIHRALVLDELARREGAMRGAWFRLREVEGEAYEHAKVVLTRRERAA